MNFERLIRRGNLIAVACLIVCVLGLTAALRVPVQMIPDLEIRTITVETRWPGATPQDIEQEILIQQEPYLRVLPNLRRMVSTASTGVATIVLEFPFGVDLNEALIRTNNALSQVSRYPENVDAPALTTESASTQPFMYFRIRPMANSGLDINLAMIRDFVEDDVRPRLERVPGVSLVELNGGSERQVRIEIDPDRLAGRGLDMIDIRDALRARNVDISGGDLDSGKRRVLVRTVGRFQQVGDLGELIVAERGGSITRLSDIAEIRLSHHERRELTFYSGEPVLIVAVRRESGANVIATKYAVLPEVDAISRDVLAPHGLEMILMNEDARYVEASVANVWQNLLLGALLATAIMYTFLRSARTTAVVVVAIPICTIASFIGLLLAGRTLNVISLAGVAFAMGMAVDNATVVLESIDQARKRGEGPFRAAVAGVSQVWPAVLACTLTTVIVFVPILFIEQEAGQLFSDIAIAMCASILASLAVAVTVVPALEARFASAHPSAMAQNDHFDRMARQLLWFTRGPIRLSLVLCGTLAASALSLILLTPPAEYLPEGEEARVFAQMIAPPGHSLTEMEAVASQLIGDLKPYLDHEPERFTRGETDMPALQFFTLFANADRIRLITDPKNLSDIEALRPALEAKLRAWPGMRAFTSRGSIISTGDDGGTRSINLNISGPDLAAIYRVAGLAYARSVGLFNGAQVSSEPSSLSLDQGVLELRPRWERLTEVGLDAERFGYALAALSDGAFVDEMILDDRRVDIYLFSSSGMNQQLHRLRDQPVATPSGTVLPVSALADLHETIGTDTVRRVDGRRTVTLSIVPPRSVALETGVARVRSDLVAAMMAAGEVPSGVSLDISGASDQLDATREALAGNFAIALLLCYLLLVSIFRHWGRPLYVMATVPLGVAGGIVGLAVLNGIGAMFELMGLGRVSQPFDMITLLGFLVLLSSVINNPILIVMETYQQLEDGAKSTAAAVGEAVRSRLRPILMSSISTIFGLLPLVVIPGEGTELYRGLGAIVVFGSAVSTVVTVTFLPCLLVAVIELQARIHRLWEGLRKPRGAPPALSSAGQDNGPPDPESRQ
jgi:multidrug efflux pump subunit AcrB